MYRIVRSLVLGNEVSQLVDCKKKCQTAQNPQNHILFLKEAPSSFLLILLVNSCFLCKRKFVRRHAQDFKQELTLMPVMSLLYFKNYLQCCEKVFAPFLISS